MPKPIIASKYFRIERLPAEEYVVRCHCLRCSLAFDCDLYHVNLEKCLIEHLEACPKAPKAFRAASAEK